jgi:toxin ParE1/3/4
MTRPIKRRPNAEQDLFEIAVFLGERSVSISDRFLDSVEDGLRQLAKMPGLGAPVLLDIPGSPDLRVWAVPGFPNHLLFYTASVEGIDLVRVLHGHRDWESDLREVNPAAPDDADP